MLNEEQRRKMREYFQNNKDKFAHYAAKQRDKLKLEMIVAYGGSCQICNEDDPIVLVLDHIDDDAHVEKELYGDNARGGHKHYGRLKAEGWPKERFQLLCHNCNYKKEFHRRRDGIFERWGYKNETDFSTAHANVKAKVTNKSGIKGVFWNTQKQRWQSKLSLKTGTVQIGFFKSIREAAEAYSLKAIELWGDEAVLPTDEEIEQAVEKEVEFFAALAKPEPTTLNAEDIGL